MKKFISILVLVCATMFTIGVFKAHQRSFDLSETVEVTDPTDSLREELIKETAGYLQDRFPQSKITPDSLVDVCIAHNFDICFALAQAEIESHMGTKGVAKKTNSPWNVGAYDGRSARTMKRKGLGYNHPNESIEPYVLLVKEKYLGETRTVEDLMMNYETLSGYRYASNPNYEKQLSKKYKKIIETTNIKSIQDNFNEVCADF